MFIQSTSVTTKLLQWFLIVTLLLFVYDNATGVEPPRPTTADELKQLNDRTLLATHVSLDASTCPLFMTELLEDQITATPEVWVTSKSGQAPRFV